MNSYNEFIAELNDIVYGTIYLKEYLDEWRMISPPPIQTAVKHRPDEPQRLRTLIYKSTGKTFKKVWKSGSEQVRYEYQLDHIEYK